MSGIQPQNIQAAYAYCMDIARAHYENFPTASFLLDRQQRLATAAIYTFARQADDFADEGELDPDTRLGLIRDYATWLDDIYAGRQVSNPVFIALADAAQRYGIPKQPLHDLLTAFSMDVRQHRYADFSGLLHYCQHSANPIGELVLRIHGAYTPENKQASDQICTALQLINFLQDIDEDMQQRDRIYIPLDELARYSLDQHDLSSRHDSAALKALLNVQLQRARAMLLSGSHLRDHLHGKLRLVITLTLCAGLSICDKLAARENSFDRPTLNKRDWIKIVLRASRFPAYRRHVKMRYAEKTDPSFSP